MRAAARFSSLTRRPSVTASPTDAKIIARPDEMIASTAIATSNSTTVKPAFRRGLAGVRMATAYSLSSVNTRTATGVCGVNTT